MNIEFFDFKDLNIIPSIVVIYAKYKGKVVMCMHEERDTWEIPGGHIEKSETPENAAERELFEETGATEFELMPICKYSFEIKGEKVFSMMYEANIFNIEKLPKFEIKKVKFFRKLPINLTYSEIYKEIFKKIGD